MVYVCYVTFSQDATEAFESFVRRTLQEPVTVQRKWQAPVQLRWVPSNDNVYVAQYTGSFEFGEVLETMRLLVRILGESGIEGGELTYIVMDIPEHDLEALKREEVSGIVVC